MVAPQASTVIAPTTVACWRRVNIRLKDHAAYTWK